MTNQVARNALGTAILWLSVMIIIASLTACQVGPQPKVDTVNDAEGLALASITASNNLIAKLVARKRITPEQAQQYAVKTDKAKSYIDLGEIAKGKSEADAIEAILLELEKENVE